MPRIRLTSLLVTSGLALATAIAAPLGAQRYDHGTPRRERRERAEDVRDRREDRRDRREDVRDRREDRRDARR